MNIDKRIVIGVLVAVILVAVGVLVYYLSSLIISNKRTEELVGSQNRNEVIVPSRRPTSAEVKAEYKNSQIEFGDKCKITISPTSTIFKSGEKIMLNNISNLPQSFTIGDFKVNLNPDEYKFVSFNPKLLPSKIPVSCGANRKIITVAAI